MFDSTPDNTLYFGTDDGILPEMMEDIEDMAPLHFGSLLGTIYFLNFILHMVKTHGFN